MLRILFSLSLFVCACADPCEQVAQLVCDCEASDSERLSCLSEVDAAQTVNTASDAQLSACEAVLAANTCTCEALASGDRSACGLTDDP